MSASSSSVSADDPETKAAAYAGLGLNDAFTQNLELGVAIDTTRINDPRRAVDGAFVQRGRHVQVPSAAPPLDAMGRDG